MLEYGTPITQALEKRSIDGNENEGQSGRETAGLVVGIIRVLLTALTMFKRMLEVEKSQ